MLLSLVRRMGFVIYFLTILVIPSAIPSLTLIAARRKTFCQSASYWASLLFLIYGLTVLLTVLARLSAALDAAIMYLFLMWVLYLHLLSALLT